MPRVASITLACMLVAAVAGCGASGLSPTGGASPSAGGSPSTAPCASSDPQAAPGCLPPGSPGESAGSVPSFTTGPTGTPIGDWSLTLTGGPSAGTYQGRDEIVCATGDGLPTSVASNPAGSPPIGHFDMVAGTSDDGILVSAGGLEAGGNYQTSSGDAEVLEAPTVTNGILHLKMSGTDPFPGDPRTLLLEVTCPLFPAETDG